MQLNRRRQSRYRATCPSCKGRIEAGHWVVPTDPDALRPRWKHEDCQHVPELQAAPDSDVAGVDSVARDQAFENQLALTELRRKLAELESATPKRIEIQVGDREPVEVEGLAHPALEEVVDLLASGEPVFMPGPTGSGKTHLAAQAATALGLKFSAISCTAGMSESQLLGRSLPTGDAGQFTFCGTPFLDCYENGGLFLFDEIDAADPNVLLVVNSALANGHLNIPARHESPTAQRHADFRCIAAANTWGRGADRLYCGRSPMDFSTLKRFPLGVVQVDYNRDLERQLWHAHCGAERDDILSTFWQYRDAIAENRLEQAVTTRDLIAFSKAIARGKSVAYVESKLFAGWRDDEVRKVKGAN